MTNLRDKFEMTSMMFADVLNLEGRKGNDKSNYQSGTCAKCRFQNMPGLMWQSKWNCFAPLPCVRKHHVVYASPRFELYGVWGDQRFSLIKSATHTLQEHPKTNALTNVSGLHGRW